MTTVAMANYANIGESVKASDVVAVSPEVERVENITSELDMKRVAKYFASVHKVSQGPSQKVLWVQRCEDGSFLMADKYLSVKVHMCPELYKYLGTFTGEGDCWGFFGKDDMPDAGGPNIQYVWELHSKDLKKLIMSRYLFDLANGSRGKTGQIARKLAVYEDGKESLRCFLDKTYTDMLSPDVEELEGFLFEAKEQVNTSNGRKYPGAVRVASRSGFCAVIMPLYMRENS